MKFDLIKKDKYSNARLGLIETAHGNIETPIFMPVGTLGTVKAVHNHELAVRIILAAKWVVRVVDEV